MCWVKKWGRGQLSFTQSCSRGTAATTASSERARSAATNPVYRGSPHLPCSLQAPSSSWHSPASPCLSLFPEQNHHNLSWSEEGKKLSTSINLCPISHVSQEPPEVSGALNQRTTRERLSSMTHATLQKGFCFKRKQGSPRAQAESMNA